jgi:hypothetical protein
VKNYLLPIQEVIIIQYPDRRRDSVAIVTDLFDPEDKEQRLYLQFSCPAGKGPDFVRETFKVEPTISVIPKPKFKFKR